MRAQWEVKGMRRMFFSAVAVVAAVLVAFVVGCGGKGSPVGEKITVPELGLSLKVPRGWKVDKHNPRLCFKDNSTGLVMDEPLEGRDFEEYVDEICRDFRGQVISKESVNVGGYAAFRVVVDHPDKGSRLMGLFIEKGDRLIEVSFVVPRDDFEKYKASLMEALDSVKVE